MITYGNAVNIIENEFSAFKYDIEQVFILDSLNRILAEDIYSDIPMPQFDNSSMDGIAIKYKSGTAQWVMKGEITAGNFVDIPIKENEAVYITTGSMLPSGCDSVIPIEDISFNNIEALLGKDIQVRKGQNIRKCGDDLAKGSLILCKNTLIKKQHISAAAACGKTSLKVFSQLKIGVLSTGDELINIDAVPVKDKIRCSNLFTMLASVTEFNMVSENFGFIKDSKEILRDKLYSILTSDLDLVITTGGVSKGKYDYMRDVFSNLGVEIRFSGVNIKPGKPLVFGVFTHNGKSKLVFGLPGNPVSALVNFIVFIRNTFFNSGISGGTYSVSAILRTDIMKNDNKRHFVRGCLSFNCMQNYAAPAGTQSSGDISGLSKSDCLIVIEEDKFNPKKGEIVECIVI